jgi:hypothetical protein
MTKLAFMSAWDDMGVCIVRDQVPHILFIEGGEVKCEPLQQYLDARKPRGAAVRKLIVDPDFPKPTTEIANIFASEAKKLKPEPWYVFSASWRSFDEDNLFTFANDFNEKKAQFRRRVREMTGGRGTKQGLKELEVRLKEMDLMCGHLADRVPKFTEFKLFNGSMVASFLAAFELLDREIPPVTRYTPQDFQYDLWTKGAHFEAPVVMFKD